MPLLELGFIFIIFSELVAITSSVYIKISGIQIPFLLNPFILLNFSILSLVLAGSFTLFIKNHFPVSSFHKRTIWLCLYGKNKHFKLFINRLLNGYSHDEIHDFLYTKTSSYYKRYQTISVIFYFLLFSFIVLCCYTFHFLNSYYFYSYILFLSAIIVTIIYSNILFIKSLSYVLKIFKLDISNFFIENKNLLFLNANYSNLLESDIKGNLIIDLEYENTYLKEDFFSIYLKDSLIYIQKRKKSGVNEALKKFSETFLKIIHSKPDIVNNMTYVSEIKVFNCPNKRNSSDLILFFLRRFSVLSSLVPKHEGDILLCLKEIITICFINGNYSKADFSHLDMSEFSNDFLSKLDHISLFNSLIAQHEKILISHQMEKTNTIKPKSINRL